jgi:hypothetical protein
MNGLLGIPAVVLIGSSVWVGADAAQRDFKNDRFADKTWKWVVGCLLLWIVVFPVYLARRNQHPIGELARAEHRRAVRYTRLAPIFWWGVASGAAMAVGAFGPWETVLGVSVGGTKGSSDGWLILGLALLVLLCAVGQHRSRLLVGIGLLAGLGGVAITAYDRNQITTVIDHAGFFGALANVGWGLNLALAASASAAIQALFAGRALASERSTVPRARPTGPPMRLAEDGGLLLPHKSTAPTSPDTPAAPPLPPQPVDAPAGWYLDPRDSRKLRYWTGNSWGEETALRLSTPAQSE